MYINAQIYNILYKFCDMKNMNSKLIIERMLKNILIFPEISQNILESICSTSKLSRVILHCIFTNAVGYYYVIIGAYKETTDAPRDRVSLSS